MGYWDNAAFGTTSPAETAEKPLSVWDNLFANTVNSLATLPKRAIDASAADMSNLGSGQPKESVAPAVETALNMIGGAGAIPAEANTLRSGLKLRELPRDNYLGPVSKHTDTLYREMAPSEALYDLPTSVASSSSGPAGAARKFYADHPDMALGQGSNRGVRVQYDAAPFEGTVNKNKPAWDLAYQNGMAEYLASPKVGANIRDSVRSFEVDPSSLSKVERAQYQRIFSNLHESGWDINRGGGKITVTRGKTE